MFAAALRALDAGRGVAIATVIGAQRLDAAAPRRADGGRRRRRAVGHGRRRARSSSSWSRRRARSPAARAPRVVRQHLVRDLAMCCGGSMEVAITPAAASREAIAQLARHARRRAMLVTPLDGGAAASCARPRPGDPRPHHPASPTARWSSGVGARERAIVFGLGHVARALGPLLAGARLRGDRVRRRRDRRARRRRRRGPSAVIESFDARRGRARGRRVRRRRLRPRSSRATTRSISSCSSS